MTLTPSCLLSRPLTGTYFCDGAGARAVMRASGQAELLGTWIRAVIPYPCVRKVFQLIGADQVVPVCASLDEAWPGRTYH